MLSSTAITQDHGNTHQAKCKPVSVPSWKSARHERKIYQRDRKSPRPCGALPVSPCDVSPVKTTRERTRRPRSGRHARRVLEKYAFIRIDTLKGHAYKKSGWIIQPMGHAPDRRRQGVGDRLRRPVLLWKPEPIGRLWRIVNGNSNDWAGVLTTRMGRAERRVGAISPTGRSDRAHSVRSLRQADCL